MQALTLAALTAAEKCTLSWFYIKSSSKVRFSVAVTAGCVKPCIIIVLNILFKHLLLPGLLDLDFMLQWLCHDFSLSLALKCISVFSFPNRVAYQTVLPCAEVKMITFTTICVSIISPCPAEPSFCKQCRSRSVGFWRSQMIWICTVCH